MCTIPQWLKPVKPVKSFLCVAFLVLHIAHVGSLDSGNDQSLLEGFHATFALRDGSVTTTTRTPAVQWVVDIMQRQNIPYDTTELRNLSNTTLFSLAMRAAIAGISPWKRLENSEFIILNEKTGIPMQETIAGDFEVPVYVSIICVMACTIILQHMRLYPPDPMTKKVAQAKSKD